MPPRPLLPVFFLLALVFPTLPAAAALTITLPRPLTAPVIEPEVFGQSVGRIAAMDTGGLAVFVNVAPGIRDVLAVRTRLDGTREDAPPLLLAELPEYSFPQPTVTAGGGVYLAAWNQGNGVMGRIVQQDGTVGPTLRLGPHDASPLRAAFNGEVFLVLWPGGGVTVDPAGRLLRQFAFMSGVSGESQLVVADGVFQLVELEQPNRAGRAITATAIHADGTVSAPVPIASPNHVQSMHAAGYGSELFVAWTTLNASTGEPTAHVSRLLHGEVQTLETLAGWREEGVVASAAGSLLFTASAGGGLYVRRIGSPGATAVAKPTQTSSLVEAVATANGTVTLFTEGFVLYTGLLEARTNERLVYAPRHQVAPAATAAGGLRLALWSELHANENRSALMAARFTADGRSLDPRGIVLGNAPWGAPKAASDGTNFLVVYNDGFHLYAQHVLADGPLLAAAPVEIGENYLSSGLDVGWDGTSYVVTWTAKDGIRAGFSEIEAMRIAPDGARSEPLALSRPGYSRYPAVAASPAGSLVVWADSYVRGALLTPFGTVVPVEFPGSFIASTAPTVAFNGKDFLVMWQRPDKLYLEWVLVSTTGVVRFPAWNTLQLYAAVAPVASAVGDDFLFAFTTPYIQLGLLSGDGYLLQPPTNTGATSSTALVLTGNQLVFGKPDEGPVRGVSRISVANVVQTPGTPKRRAAGH